MTSPVAAVPVKTRHDWMDLFRGGAILLVLSWHAPAIPLLLGFDIPEWLRAVNNAFLPFRMPGLMFLSGLLLARSLRKPLAPYYWGKFQSIAWPYALWAVLHVVQYGSPNEWYQWRAWYGTGYLWFLFFILVYYAIAPAVTRLPAWTTPLVPFVVALALPTGKDERLAYFAVFFFAGYVVTTYPTLLDRLLARRFLPVYVVLALVGATIAARAGVGSAYDPLLAPLSLSGILILIVLSRRLEGATWTSGLRAVGRNSIVYYVSHFPLILCVAYLAQATGVGNGWQIAVVGFVVALAGGWVLVRLRHVVPVRWLFEAPDFLSIVRRGREATR